MNDSQVYKLTEYSHGGGCGCKIAPKVLDDILKSNLSEPDNASLLVGNHSKDDAAVYDLGNGNALISTTDFFMPIVDDAYDFGRIASANAISDVYAMGGRPMLAIAILGWPVNTLPAWVAQRVLEGSRAVCAQAGIPLAGGHSIDTKEPMFGLAVNGLVNIRNLKKNNAARAGDVLYLTKPIGAGIMATAQKRKVLADKHAAALVQQLTTLNRVGELLGKLEGVHAMTDVTGFGVLGHLVEMTEGSNLSAELYYSKLQLMDGLQEYIEQKTIPGACGRNWDSYSFKVALSPMLPQAEATTILPDPQTNGGLLVAVDPEATAAVEKLLAENGLEAFATPIGQMTAKKEKVVYVH